jgi:hypothetical protein
MIHASISNHPAGLIFIAIYVGDILVAAKDKSKLLLPKPKKKKKII